MTLRERATVYEVVMKTSLAEEGYVDILRQVLLNVGVASNQIVECEEWPFVQLSVFYRSLDKARHLKKKLGAAHLKNVHVAVKVLAEGAEFEKQEGKCKINPGTYCADNSLKPSDVVNGDECSVITTCNNDKTDCGVKADGVESETEDTCKAKLGCEWVKSKTDADKGNCQEKTKDCTEKDMSDCTAENGCVLAAK